MKTITPKNGKIRWSSNTIYVDIDTGERITQIDAKQNYITLKSSKHATINNTKTKGHVEYTKQCRRKYKQLELF